MKHQPSTQPQAEIRFTQNFLRDPKLVSGLVKQADIQPNDTVLEIGPGKGIITDALAKAVGIGGLVIAVELDAALATRLVDIFGPLPQVRIVAGDILTLKNANFPRSYKVFANIPFNITSPLLEYLFDAQTGPEAAHLILQIDALVSTNEHALNLETFKSLMIKPLYDISIEHHLKRSDFSPQPAVETALFGFIKRPMPLINPADYYFYKDFLAFVSKDRVGEGVWTRIFSKQQIHMLAERTDIVIGRGMKMQTVQALISAFEVFAARNKSKHEIVRGSMSNLRAEQERREQVNLAGGHRRPRRPSE